MANPIDFARMSLKDALDLAILVEEEAAERYEELAEQMETHHSPDAAGFFRMMIQYERKHGDELSGRRRALFGESERSVDRSMLWDVEAPSYDRVEMFMSARDALLVALDSERKAHQFFVESIEHCADLEVRALFEELREEEVHHQELVKQELENLPESRGPAAANYSDDPVAQ